MNEQANEMAVEDVEALPSPEEFPEGEGTKANLWEDDKEASEGDPAPAEAPPQG